MNSALKARGKRLRCWFGLHFWVMYLKDFRRGYHDRCIYCGKPKK